MDLAEADPARESVEQIELGAKRAADLAGTLLAYSGRGRFVVRPLDASELVRETARLLRVSIGGGAAVHYELAEDLPPIEGDSTQLRQVVMNLVINAAEAMGDGEGAITVRTALTDVGPDDLDDYVADESFRPGRYVLLEVADTGHGMDEATRTRIFDPFFTTKFTGRGLGLAAAQGIVRGHHGAIGVSSEPGRGARFRILLPAVEGTADAPATTGQSAPVPPAAATVLVIDDEESVRRATARMLQAVGFRTIMAADGPAGVELFREQADVDVVLVDFTMPRMSGIEVARAIRAIRPGAAIVLMSGYDEPAQDGAAGEASPAGFIQKPFTLAQLGDTIRAALESR